MDFQKISQLIDKMADWEAGNPKRINHYLKVWGYAKTIGELEGLDESTRYTLEAAVVVHDIGIKPAEKKFGCHDGPYQEKEGILPAKEMLLSLGFSEQTAERVSFLVGHHHTYTAIDGIDFQILVEADFLVNLDEGKRGEEAVRTAREKYFRTQAGIRFLERLFPVLLP